MLAAHLQHSAERRQQLFLLSPVEAGDAERVQGLEPVQREPLLVGGAAVAQGACGGEKKEKACSGRECAT